MPTRPTPSKKIPLMRRLLNSFSMGEILPLKIALKIIKFLYVARDKRLFVRVAGA